MHIVILNQFFYPDWAATSQLATDLAVELGARGHRVTAICARSGYGAKAPAAGETRSFENVRIVRTYSLPFARSAAGRLLSYASFLLGAAWGLIRIQRPDVVITLTTPPVLALLGTLVKWTRGARHYSWEMDVYPDVAVDLGMMGAGSAATRAIGAVLDFGRRRADGIIALGDCMKERLVARGIPAERIQVAENWADGRAIYPLPFGENGRLTVLYSGNFGLAHDVETIREAMLRLGKSGGFRFVFAGGGPQWKALESVEGAEFRPYCSREELGRSYGEADIGLITQEAGTSGSVTPSKTYGVMAAGRPILFIGPGGATPARIIRRFQCGWHIECGDAEGAVGLLKHLAENPSVIREAGRKAREAFVQNYDLPIGVGRICTIVGVDAAEGSRQSSAVSHQ